MWAMIFRTRVPAAPLCHFVEYFWYHRGIVADYAREKLLPDGAIELVIDLDQTPKKLFDRENPDEYEGFHGAWISGQQQEYLVIEAAQDSHMIGVRFRPGGAYPFFSFPMSELNGWVVQLDLIWGRLVERLRQRLSETAGIAGKFRLLEDFLMTRALHVLEVDRCLHFSLAQLQQAPEALTIRELSQRAGVSQKCLIEKFNRHVGLRPKLLSRIFKFQKVLACIEREQPLVWSDLALECGYYDQPHFIHEFQAFSGMNPSRYLVEKGEYFNWVPVRG